MGRNSALLICSECFSRRKTKKIAKKLSIFYANSLAVELELISDRPVHGFGRSWGIRAGPFAVPTVRGVYVRVRSWSQLPVVYTPVRGAALGDFGGTIPLRCVFAAYLHVVWFL